MSLARRKTWARLLRRTLIGVAVIVGATVLASGCRGDDEVSTQDVSLNDLRKMVVPKEDLGVLGLGLRVSGGSGWVTNSMSANHSFDPKDSGRSLSQLGRLGGYELTYSDPRGYNSNDEERPIAVSTALELFSSEAAAAAYLRDGIADAVRLRGKRLPTGRLATAEQFRGGDVGEEAEGLRTAFRVEGNVGFASYVAFRRGRLVATATAWRRAETKSPTDALQIADALDARISGVASGEIDDVAVKLPPREWWYAAPDPRPLTLEPRAVATGARLHERKYLRSHDSIGYSRDYKLSRSPLGDSRILFLLTRTDVFKSARLAARDQRRFTPAKARADVTRGFLSAASRGAKLRHVTAERLESARYPDTTALQVDLDTSAARMTGVFVAVRRGRLVGSVGVIGFASELRVEDVLPLREKLLARLATA